MVFWSSEKWAYIAHIVNDPYDPLLSHVRVHCFVVKISFKCQSLYQTSVCCNSRDDRQ